MKKFFTILAIIICLTVGGQVLAVNLNQGNLMGTAATQAGYGPTNATSLASLVGMVIAVALSLVGLIFLVLMVYAGYLWMTAHGEEEKVKTAQTIIKQSIIGLIIVIGAYSITYYIVPILVNYTANGNN